MDRCNGCEKRGVIFYLHDETAISAQEYYIRCLYEKNQFVLGQLRKYFSCEFTCQIMLQYSFPFRMNFLFAVEDKKRFPGDGFDSRLLDSKSTKSLGKASLVDGKWHHHYHRFRIIYRSRIRWLCNRCLANIRDSLRHSFYSSVVFENHYLEILDFQKVFTNYGVFSVNGLQKQQKESFQDSLLLS